MSAIESANTVNDTFKDMGLIRPSRESLASVSLPDTSKQFLQLAGLPAVELFGFNFNPVRNLPTVIDYATERRYPFVQRTRMHDRCIGESFGVVLALANGAWDVWWLDLQGQNPEMFVNSNVETFGASLAAYASLSRQHDQSTPAQLSAEFQNTLSRIDPACVEGWWSTVIQEIEFGLS